jgi:hypothetical protein
MSGEEYIATGKIAVRYRVVLQVYKMVQTPWMKRITSLFGKRPFHSGLGISPIGMSCQSSWEYTFAGDSHNRTGVFDQKDRVPADFAAHYESIDMGEFEMAPMQYHNIVQQLKQQWPANSYHLLWRNCNHFCEEVLKCFCVGKRAPAYINALANSARQKYYLVPSFLEHVLHHQSGPYQYHGALVGSVVGAEALANVSEKTRKVAGLANVSASSRWHALRAQRSRKSCSGVDETESAPESVEKRSHSLQVPLDTTGDGRPDTVAIDATGDGHLDTLVALSSSGKNMCSQASSSTGGSGKKSLRHSNSENSRRRGTNRGDIYKVLVGTMLSK